MAYNILRTDGNAILVQPGTVDGPANTTGGFTPQTDIDLYGQGTLNWGIGVDQNQLRLLENWAIGSVLTSPLPVTIYSTYRPKNESEVGPNGTGINRPSIGQTWFNTDNNKLYVCTALGATPNDATWITAGADPDLFVPILGGTFTGNIEIDKNAPNFALGNNGGLSDLAIYFNATSLLAASIYYDTSSAAFSIRNDDGTGGIINQMVLLESHIEFLGGTGSNGADGGKVRTPTTVTGDNGNVVTTKDFVELEFVSKHGQTVGSVMDGNLRIEKASPQMVLEDLTGNNSTIYFDKAGVTDGLIQMYNDGTAGVNSKRLQFQIRTGSTVENRLSIYRNRIETTGQEGKIWTDDTVSGDSGNILTTKSYVDAEITTLSNAASAAYMLNTGDTATGQYKFGPAFDDISIQNSEFISTSATGSTTIVGDIVELKQGGNTGTLDGLGATWTTGGVPDKKTIITDGGARIEEDATNHTRIVGPEITSTKSTGITGIIDGNSAVFTHTSGGIVDISATGSSIIDLSVTNAAGESKLRLQQPDNQFTSNSAVEFYTGAVGSTGDIRATMTLYSNVAVNGNTNTRDQFRIEKYGAGGLAEKNQRLILRDDGLAVSGWDQNPVAKLLIQRDNDSDGIVGELNFQIPNAAATGPSVEFKSEGYLNLTKDAGGNQFVLGKTYDTTSAESGRITFQDDYIGVVKILTNGTSVGGRMLCYDDEVAFLGGPVRIADDAGPKLNNQAIAVRTFIQSNFPPTSIVRSGDMCVTDGTGTDPTQESVWIAHTDAGIDYWTPIVNAYSPYVRN